MFAAGELILRCEVYGHVVAAELRTEVCDYCLVRKRGALFQAPGQPEPEPLRRCSKCQVPVSTTAILLHQCVGLQKKAIKEAWLEADVFGWDGFDSANFNTGVGA